MKGTRAASRYAKSLLELAVEKNNLEDVQTDMIAIEQLCADSRELTNMLNSPIIKTDQKWTALSEILSKMAVNDLTVSFVKIVTEKKRESLLPVIADAFQKQYRKHKNITLANVKSAIKLDNDLKAKIEALVKTQATGEVQFSEIVDENLIGGFVLTIEDQQIDASIKAKLSKLKQRFSDNLYVADY